MVFLGLNCLIFAETIPPISNIIAVMRDAPRTGQGLRFVDPVNSIKYTRTVYHVLKPSCLVEVYVSRDLRPFKWGPSNIQFPPVFGNSRINNPEYQVVQGKPSYCLSRADGWWFLFVFPDQPIDVSAFIQRFGEGFGFFESRLPSAKVEDWLPSVLGSLGAKN